MVTNPATRDWTVTASLFATLNEMYGNRTVCGIGRGDSAVRVTNGKPTTLDTLRESVHVIRELANGRSVDYRDSTLTLPVGIAQRARGVGGGVRPEGAGTHRRGRRRVHPPARRSADRRVDGQGSSSRRRPTQDATPTRSRSASPLPPTSATTASTCRDQCRWFGGMVGNHVADLVGRYGDTGAVPEALTEYIAGRQGYDYNQHGQAGNTHTVVRARRDRRAVLHPRHTRRTPRAARGAAPARRRPVRRVPPARRQGRRRSQAYGEHVIPRIHEQRLARQ
ncbi:MAG: LLM class flavin-dependent oxidoreductase [Ilumatobacteraceae bacterium]